MKNCIALQPGIWLAVLTIALLALVLLAGSNRIANAEEEAWGFTVKFPMVWVAEIDGAINISDFELDASQTFKDKLDTLTFGIMTEFYAQKGPWIYSLKLNYESGEDGFVTREFSLPPGIPPVFPSHRIETKIQQGTLDAIVGYKFDSGFQLYSGG